MASEILLNLVVLSFAADVAGDPCASRNVRVLSRTAVNGVMRMGQLRKLRRTVRRECHNICPSISNPAVAAEVEQRRRASHHTCLQYCPRRRLKTNKSTRVRANVQVHSSDCGRVVR